MSQVTVANFFGFSIADVKNLKLWEFSILVDEVKRHQSGGERTSSGGRIPVMS